jgi:DNA-binding GntR family transcriptional regulator
LLGHPVSVLPRQDPLTLGGEIAAKIRDKILAGTYAPGSALLQDAIAAEFGVSKIPVREALVRLKAEGLIDIYAHRGFKVRGLSAAEVDEVFSLRLVLEPRAVAEGSRRAVSGDHMAAREALRALSQALSTTSLDDIGRLNGVFHLSLVLPRRVPVTYDILSRLHTLSRRYVRLHLKPAGRSRRATDEHNALFEAWAGGDAAAAGQLVEDHIEATRLELARALAPAKAL